jgi:hypothetical protein
MLYPWLPLTPCWHPLGGAGNQSAGAVGPKIQVTTLDPETRYARAGDIRGAFQVLGDEPRDLVLVPGIVSHLELAWEHPPYERFMRALSVRARVIVFDKRGSGLSDPIDRAATIEERNDDIRAVMDAVQGGLPRRDDVGLLQGVGEEIARGGRHPSIHFHGPDSSAGGSSGTITSRRADREANYSGRGPDGEDGRGQSAGAWWFSSSVALLPRPVGKGHLDAGDRYVDARGGEGADGPPQPAG